MEPRDALQQMVRELPEDQLREVLDFARFITRDNTSWRAFGQRQFARAYGTNEPEYTEADLKQNPEL